MMSSKVSSDKTFPNTRGGVSERNEQVLIRASNEIQNKYCQISCMRGEAFILLGGGRPLSSMWNSLISTLQKQISPFQVEDTYIL